MVQANRVKVAPKLSMKEAWEFYDDYAAATPVEAVSLGASIPFIYPNFFFSKVCLLIFEYCLIIF